MTDMSGKIREDYSVRVVRRDANGEYDYTDVADGDDVVIPFDRSSAPSGPVVPGEVIDLDAADAAARSGDERDDNDATEPDGSDPAGLLVDSVEAQRRPRFTLAGLRDGQRRPILPGWVKSRTEFVGNAAWLVGFSAYGTAYHGVRLPKYLLRLAFRAPRGAAKSVRGYVRWLLDLEGEPVRQSIVRAATVRPDEARTYERLSRQRDRRVRWRGIVTTALTVGGLVGLLVLLLAAPSWLPYVLAAVTVTVFGVIGTPADRPLLDTAVVRNGVMPLTSEE